MTSVHVGRVLVELGHKVPGGGDGLAGVEVQHKSGALSPGREGHAHTYHALVERAGHGWRGVPAPAAASNLTTNTQVGWVILRTNTASNLTTHTQVGWAMLRTNTASNLTTYIEVGWVILRTNTSNLTTHTHTGRVGRLEDKYSQQPDNIHTGKVGHLRHTQQTA